MLMVDVQDHYLPTLHAETLWHNRNTVQSSFKQKSLCQGPVSVVSPIHDQSYYPIQNNQTTVLLQWSTNDYSPGSTPKSPKRGRSGKKGKVPEPEPEPEPEVPTGPPPPLPGSEEWEFVDQSLELVSAPLLLHYQLLMFRERGAFWNLEFHIEQY